MQTFVLFRSVQCLLKHESIYVYVCPYEMLEIQFYLFYFPRVLRSKLQQMSNAFTVAQQEMIWLERFVGHAEHVYCLNVCSVWFPGGLGDPGVGAFHFHRRSRNRQDHSGTRHVQEPIHVRLGETCQSKAAALMFCRILFQLRLLGRDHVEGDMPPLVIEFE